MQLTVDFENYETPTTRSPELVLWLYVIEDAYNNAMKGSKAALAWFYHSAQFEMLCTELGWNVGEIRRRIIPTWFAEWITEQRQRPVVPRTDKPDNRPAEESYYMRKKHECEAAERPIPAPTSPLGAPAATSGAIFQAVLAAAPEELEDALALALAHHSIDEWEAFAERIEIESVMHLQQKGTENHVPSQL